MMIAYLASPYTHPDPAMLQRRFEIVGVALAMLMNKGYVVFSPIAMTHTVAMMRDLPKNYEYWHGFNCAFIDKCDELWVLCIDGWRESRGINAEIEYAKSTSKPVRYWAFMLDDDIVEVIQAAQQAQESSDAETHGEDS